MKKLNSYHHNLITSLGIVLDFQASAACASGVCLILLFKVLYTDTGSNSPCSNFHIWPDRVLNPYPPVIEWTL